MTLPEKLHIDLSRDRCRHSKDNALVESGNGSVVRKCIGYFPDNPTLPARG